LKKTDKKPFRPEDASGAGALRHWVTTKGRECRSSPKKRDSVGKSQLWRK